ncbi:hypothetical protein [Streptomyces sp. UNOC14_S4]|uniref:hypothetical protein n=1 Tax=Streptomyces sp. UNOC14_S4 TaxID=2872340 RepID=UPI001E54187D|nr:hypothetical protein [Streptomyces sp. UNOC14_S4]MCC3766469.1 hypothetical protein [Streptomyces sp. UNOC14_S4]
MGARARRIKRIREVLPIVVELEDYTQQVYADDLFTTEEGRDASPLWLATPFSHTRDSGLLEECNWKVVTESLSKFSDTVQEMRFGHWGWGWSERIYVRKDDALALRDIQQFIDALSDYPVLDDERLSRMETEELNDYIRSQVDDDLVDPVRQQLRERHDVIRAEDVDQDMIKDVLGSVPHAYDQWDTEVDECEACGQPRAAECRVVSL